MKRIFFVGMLATLGMVSTTAANAMDEEEGSKFRAGIGVGKVKIKADDIDLEDSTTGWEIFGGWELNRYLAFEAGYLDGGETKDAIGSAVIEADTKAYMASVLGSFPVTDGFSIYGRAGYMHWKADEEARIGGVTVATAKVDGEDPIFGAGLAAHIEGALLRAEYRFADLDDTDLKFISIAIAWRF